MNNIFVIAEAMEGTLDRLSAEALGCARELSHITDGTVRMVLLGARTNDARIIAERYGFDVLSLAGQSLERYRADAWFYALRSLFVQYPPSIICVPGSSRGMDFAPALSASLNCRFIPGTMRVRSDEGTIICTRQYWHGKLEMDLAWQGETLVLACQAGAFNEPQRGDEHGRVEIISTVPSPGKTEALGVVRIDNPEGAELTHAEVIVTAGRGMGSKENCDLLQELAERFPRSARGASRPVCDYGWLPYSRQVGQTGKTVAPKLYIACGISGSLQHIAGMKGSEYIVAINTDPHAPIFRHAHAGIVADCPGFIRELLHFLDEKAK